MKKTKDANFIGQCYLPAAGASVRTDYFHLGAVKGDPGPSLCDVEVIIPALPANVDAAKTILLELQDSANGNDFANTNPLIQCQVVGVVTTGSGETKLYFRLPPEVREYIALYITVPTGAGDNTEQQITWSLLF